jgi:ribosome-binding protein aMBF1 (putative translation factor)
MPTTSFDTYLQQVTERSAEERDLLDAARTRVRLGLSVRSLREARSLTQRYLAEVSGVQQPEISRIESGLANPTAHTLAELGRALGASLELQPVERRVPQTPAS